MTGTNMQMVFDALRGIAGAMSMPELCQRCAHLHKTSVHQATYALVRSGAVIASGPHNARLYRLREGAARPEDLRGKKGGGVPANGR